MEADFSAIQHGVLTGHRVSVPRFLLPLGPEDDCGDGLVCPAHSEDYEKWIGGHLAAVEPSSPQESRAVVPQLTPLPGSQARLLR